MIAPGKINLNKISSDFMANYSCSPDISGLKAAFPCFLNQPKDNLNFIPFLLAQQIASVISIFISIVRSAIWHAGHIGEVLDVQEHGNGLGLSEGQSANAHRSQFSLLTKVSSTHTLATQFTLHWGNKQVVLGKTQWENVTTSYALNYFYCLTHARKIRPTLAGLFGWRWKRPLDANQSAESFQAKLHRGKEYALMVFLDSDFVL